MWFLSNGDWKKKKKMTILIKEWWLRHRKLVAMWWLETINLHTYFTSYKNVVGFLTNNAILSNVWYCNFVLKINQFKLKFWRIILDCSSLKSKFLQKFRKYIQTKNLNRTTFSENSKWWWHHDWIFLRKKLNPNGKCRGLWGPKWGLWENYTKNGNYCIKKGKS